MRSLGKLVLAIICATLLYASGGCGEDKGPGPSRTSNILLKPDGSGDYPTIQAAVDAADSSQVIELLDGTYKGDGNRDIDYQGKAITIRSSSGDPSKCIIDCQGSAQNPRRAFYFHSGEGAGSVLKAITVRNGYVKGGPSLGGGAIHFRQSAPTITDCVFMNNTCEGWGGALYCGGTASPVISKCRFYQNSAIKYQAGPFSTGGSGGAMCCAWGSPALTDCVFSDNSAEYGGAMVCANGGFVLDGCSFNDNSADFGAGVFCRCDRSSPVFMNCAFSRNSAADDGGGMWCEKNSSARISDCTFTGNSAMGAGGGLYAEETAALFTQCTFLQNSAYSGGAGWLERVSASGGSSPNFDGCVVSRNSAENGGGFYLAFATPAFAGCVLSSNSANLAGGGIFCYDSSPSVTNCTFCGNSADVGGGITSRRAASSVELENTIIAFSGGGGAVYCDDDGTATLTCCDIYGNTGGDWVGCVAEQGGQGDNICTDPLFCDSDNGNFRLQETSFCGPDSSDCGLIGAEPVGCE